MAFDNKTMPTKVPSKPHIALIQGWWRVSSIKLKGKRFHKPPTGCHWALTERWSKAHAFARKLNNNLHWPDPEKLRR